MSQMEVLDIMREALKAVIFTSAPPLLLGLIVGLIVSIFQAVTSIQEPTLAFIPKIVAVLASLLLFGTFMLSSLQNIFYVLYNNIPNYVR